MDQTKTDNYWMQQALALAERASDEGEIPVGAIVVKDGKSISEGWNQPISKHDPSAHAEMQAIRAACSAVQNYRLIDTTLYVTLEPCPMCAGLLVHSRISRLVIGASDYKTGACGSVMDLVRNPSLNHQVEVVTGILEKECGDILSNFFKRRRAEKKELKRKAT